MSVMKEYDKLIVQNRETLELMYANVNYAMRHGEKDAKIRAIKDAISSGVIDNDSYLEETKKIFESQKIAFHITKLHLLDERSLRFCTIGCSNAIRKKLIENEQYTAKYTPAYTTIFEPKEKFEKSQVLYNNDKGEELKVADLLSVVDYSLTIAKSINPKDENIRTIDDTKIVLQAVDLALNNKPQDKPINKLLHLAVGFISSNVMKNLDNKQDERGCTIGAGILNLAIDFLCRR